MGTGHSHHEHDHGHGAGHDHGARHAHEPQPGRWASRPAARESRLRHEMKHLAQPHTHDAAAKVDRVMESSAAGTRTLWISLAGLGGTAVAQAAAVAISGSVGIEASRAQKPGGAGRR
jgi:hypothetical protein